MKFDVVAGNPPYSRGADIDFAAFGFNNCNNYCLMITPAKWQNAESDQSIQSEMSYGQFRKEIVPHIKYLCFYPECSELFAIRVISGISYYLIDKHNTHENKCKVENKCRLQPIFNGIVVRDITHQQTLFNIGHEIIEKLGNFKSFEFEHRGIKRRFKVYTGSQLNCGCGWGYLDRENPCNTFDRSGRLYCVGTSRIEDNTQETKNARGAETLTFESDDKEECENFIAWLNTDIVRFLVYMNVSKLNNAMTNHYFRFVPKPLDSNFRHKYTSEELYKELNLESKYIKIIRSVIKERT